jgi:hypothetical protein
MTGVGSNGRVNFDLSTGTIGQVVGTNLTAEIIDVGNGWYRCVVKLSSAASNGTGYLQFNLVNSATATPGQAYLGDGTSGVLVWGIQLEAGSAFATSYIPSLSNSSTTRSADVCQITGSDFSGFWNGTEGTLAAEWDATRNSTGQFTVYWVRDSADNNTVLHTGRDALSPPGVRFEAISGASSSAQLINAGFPDPGIQVKTAGCYKANDFAYSYNGAAALTDTSGAVPVNPTQIRIGYDPYGTWLNGHIARLRYFNKRLPNATLQQLST